MYHHASRASVNHKIPANYRYIDIDLINTTNNPALSSVQNTKYGVFEIIIDYTTNPHQRQIRTVVNNVSKEYALSIYNRYGDYKQ
jgi:hypothetical protein